MASNNNSSNPPPPSEGEEQGIASHFILPSPKAKAKKKKSSSSRKESIFLLLIGIFILNSINGQKIVKSVNSQYEEWQDYLMPTAEQPGGYGQPGQKKNESTAIIITSSSIPSHPSTYMLEKVLNSTEHLKGLSPTAPIIITVDHFRFSDFSNLPPALEQRIGQLDEYIINLMNLYMTDPRIHIIPSVKNLHIGGNVMKALNLIERHYPSVRYVYYLQHDFFFTRDIDHLALENVMDVYHDKINYVRFPKREPWRISRTCGQEPAIVYNKTIHSITTTTTADNNIDTTDDNKDDNGNNETETKTASGQLTLSPTSAYSDNNHLVRLKWYKETIASLIKLNRAPEDPLQVRANYGCGGGGPHPITGLYLYQDMCIGHLDGRHTASTP